MTINGLIRSHVAAVRRDEREKLRRLREAARQYKLYEKAKQFQTASEAVANYEKYIELVTTIHCAYVYAIEWETLANLEEPIPPVISNEHKSFAENKLLNYKPNIFEKVLGLQKSKTARLQNEVEKGKQQDSELYFEKLTKYRKEKSRVIETKALANRILSKDFKAFEEAFLEYKPFEDFAVIGKEVVVNCFSNCAICSLNVHGVEIIPNFERSLMKTGRISDKKMPESRRFEMYQDFVCGGAIRIAREAFGLLPIKYVLVNVLSDLIDKMDGHVKPQPILSVLFVRDTLEMMNVEKIDCSDSMKNFVHNMSFSKKAGFSITKLVDVSHYIEQDNINH